MMLPTIHTWAQSGNKTDSSSVVVVKKEPEAKTKTVSTFKPNPKTAMLLSAVIPGGGQIYNRSYWKAPIVWGGYAALIYAISWNSKMYNDYHKAYISIADNDESTKYYEKYIPDGKTLESIGKTWLTNALFQKNNSYRRSRDLSILGMIGFYGLTILDSYVDAQLYDFDISPDLSLHLEPTLYNSGNFNDNTIGVSCSLSF